MKRRVWAAVALLALTAGWAAVPAGASTFLAVSQDHLVAHAEAVVEGEVLEVASFWNAEHTAILTEAVLRVDDTLVGTAPAFVNLRTFGGKVGGYTIVAHGFPTFEVGQKLLLFLEPEKDGAHRVLGYRQGQFFLKGGPGGRIALPAVTVDERYVRADGKAVSAPGKGLPFDQLRKQIQDAAGRAGRPVVR
jgi:hypothetical protein